MFNAIDTICEVIQPDDRLILQVHLTDINSSLHCIAVHGNKLLDPADGIWHELCVDSFMKLHIDELIAGFKIKDVPKPKKRKKNGGKKKRDKRIKPE